MSRRPRPQYRSGLGWILGVAFPDTLTRPARLAQGFTYIRCCGSPRASSPHGLTAPALASHDGKDCVQLPPARGCYHLAPRRTFTSNPVPMPGTPGRGAGYAGCRFPNWRERRQDRRTRARDRAAAGRSRFFSRSLAAHRRAGPLSERRITRSSKRERAGDARRLCIQRLCGLAEFRAPASIVR